MNRRCSCCCCCTCCRRPMWSQSKERLPEFVSELLLGARRSQSNRRLLIIIKLRLTRVAVRNPGPNVESFRNFSSPQIQRLFFWRLFLFGWVQVPETLYFTLSKLKQLRRFRKRLFRPVVENSTASASKRNFCLLIEEEKFNSNRIKVL